MLLLGKFLQIQLLEYDAFKISYHRHREMQYMDGHLV